MSKARYDEKAIERGLHRHLEAGAIRRFRRPVDGEPARWLVTIPGFADVEFTTPQAYALCVGLAAGERRADRLLAAATKPVERDVSALVDPGEFDPEGARVEFGNPDGDF